jgi:hypothetical protein
MKIDYKQFLFACVFVLVVCILYIVLPRDYQFCTGSCTGDLSNCFCAMTPNTSISFYGWLSVLLGSAYYHIKAKPPFLTLLVVAIALFIVSGAALIATSLLPVSLAPSSY